MPRADADQLAKTDALAAKILAQFGRVMKPPVGAQHDAKMQAFGALQAVAWHTCGLTQSHQTIHSPKFSKTSPRFSVEHTYPFGRSTLQGDIVVVLLAKNLIQQTGPSHSYCVFTFEQNLNTKSLRSA